MAPRRAWRDPHPLDGRVLAWHGMSRLVDRRVIARSPEDVRLVVRILKRLAARMGAQVLAFAVVDTHLHTLVTGDRFRAGEWLRRVEISVSQALGHGVGFDRCYLKPVESQAYLANCFRYVLTQQDHHATFGDPWWEGSALHELNGLRLGSLAANLRMYLPRVGAAECAEMLGVPDELLARWDEPIELGEIDGLLEAVTVALELEGLPAHGRAWTGGRRAALLSISDGVPVAVVSEALGVVPRTVRRLRQQEGAAPAAVRAVRRQLRYRAWGRELG